MSPTRRLVLILQPQFSKNCNPRYNKRSEPGVSTSSALYAAYSRLFSRPFLSRVGLCQRTAWKRRPMQTHKPLTATCSLWLWLNLGLTPTHPCPELNSAAVTCENCHVPHLVPEWRRRWWLHVKMCIFFKVKTVKYGIIVQFTMFTQTKGWTLTATVPDPRFCNSSL